jgi:glutamine amidotransferase
MNVVIIDYGSGNLRSAAKAFERVDAESGIAARIAVSGDAAAIDAADRIVLPGVGAFGDCMAGLMALPGVRAALERNVREKGKPFLGICVGMQLMAERGVEHGVHRGLGWIAGEVRPIPANGLKVPHMGWNELAVARVDHPVLAGIASGAHAYFVHSYALQCENAADIAARTDYGTPLVAVVARANLIGTQFHPEKSQATGLRLIRNFLAWRP